MFQDLLNAEDCDEACAEAFGFSGVTMKRDFGPLKQGEKVANIWFDLESREVRTYADDGKTVIHTFKFQLIAA